MLSAAKNIEMTSHLYSLHWTLLLCANNVHKCENVNCFN